jgi:phenylacetate-CoA ligase
VLQRFYCLGKFVLEIAFAQLRFAASVGLGIPFSLRSLDRIIESLQATRREFGALGAAGVPLIQGPGLDEPTRREIQLRRFRAQARRAREAPYYSRLFAHLDLDPARMSWDDIGCFPLTPKTALRDQPDDFVRRTARPAFRTTTTGTTGQPTSVCFSAHEMQTYIALGAIHNLFTSAITDTDIVQLSTSARATLGNSCFIGACLRVDALVYLSGLVAPARSLALLTEERRISGKKPRANVLQIYPSYLGELVEVGLRLGYRPADFGLERIHIGGEIVTAGLKARCQQLFGPVEFIEGFGMTEVWPSTGARCEAGHLHFEPLQGLLEVWDLETNAPAHPGEVGTLVLTPLPPYRETSLVLRYDTEDLVQAVAEPLTCSLRDLPAVSNLLGKRRLAIRHIHGWTTPRDVLEALESLDTVPLPARCGFWAAPGGVALEVMTRDDAPHIRRQVAQALEERGVPLQELYLCTDHRQLRQPYPLRGDLREATFDESEPPIGRADET